MAMPIARATHHLARPSRADGTRVPLLDIPELLAILRATPGWTELDAGPRSDAANNGPDAAGTASGRGAHHRHLAGSATERHLARRAERERLMRERAEELLEREHRLDHAADAHASAEAPALSDSLLDEAAAASGLRASWERDAAQRPPPRVRQA